LEYKKKEKEEPMKGRGQRERGTSQSLAGKPSHGSESGRQKTTIKSDQRNRVSKPMPQPRGNKKGKDYLSINEGIEADKSKTRGEKMCDEGD